jgi:hypothetical protein
MKIKRFKNLWLMGLILSASILSVIYILKIFFPQFVIEVAQIDSITRIGHYIDTHKWAWHIFTAILSFANYYLICCASSNRYTLKNKEYLYIIATILSLSLIKEFLPAQYTACNIISLLLLPYLCKGNFKSTLCIFISTNLLQTITLEIRGLISMATNLNYATIIILTIDVYILSALWYFYYNYRKGE